MALSRKLRETVCEKLNIKSAQLYNRISAKAIEAGVTDRDVALLLLAHENKIDVAKPRFAVPQPKLDALDKYMVRRGTSQAPILLSQSTTKPRTSRKNENKQIVFDLGRDLRITDPLLPKKIVDDAKEMAGVYPVIYIFENSVRNLVSDVMKTKYHDSWWESRVGASIKRRVRERIEKEDKNRWHGKRGAHPIFYTDIDDLKSIITANWSDFEGIFPNQQWVTGKIDEIEMSRNVIAHNNPLEERDVTRLRLNLQDWISQISRWMEKANSQ